MKVAFLSDIHANFPALSAALQCAAEAGAEEVVCAGDLVGGGPHPTEVVRLLMRQGVRSVAGNVERKVLALAADPKKLKKARDKKKGAPLAWTARALGEDERAWLASLPREIRHDWGSGEVWVVHGSPLGEEDYLFPSITAPGLAPRLRGAAPAALVCGHSHIPFVKAVGSTLVVNCGSVGRPVDGDPRGALALADFTPGRRPSARILRFPYPVAGVVDDLDARRVPGVDPADFVLGVKKR